MIFKEITSTKVQWTGNSLSLQTDWTGFNPYICSGGSSSAASTLVESRNCKVFCTQQGHCDGHNACHTLRARMVCSVSRVYCQPGL